eukprot:5274369-Alexandrium_andersonii.AAC.1
MTGRPGAGAARSKPRVEARSARRGSGRIGRAPQSRCPCATVSCTLLRCVGGSAFPPQHHCRHSSCSARAHPGRFLQGTRHRSKQHLNDSISLDDAWCVTVVHEPGRPERPEDLSTRQLPAA